MTSLVTKLADRSVPLIIGEIAQNHDGSLGMCHAYVDALADAGADAVKFQAHIADEESTLDERFRIKFSQQDETRYDYWRRMEFSESQWLELKRHADDAGIGFICTPFSAAAVEMLQRVGVELWKIGSGDTELAELADPMIASGKPLIISSGMSGWSEIDVTAKRLRDAGADFALMQCTSQYPTPLDQVGLNNLPEMQERYGCRVGLSDHSGSLTPSLAAIARGFTLVEVHATFDKRMFGPDVSASLSIEEIAEMARFARDLATIDRNPVDKDAKADELGAQKSLFGRSVGLKTDLVAGQIITAGDLTPKKPGGGIAWSDKDALIGRELIHDAPRNRLLKQEDLK
jgi:N-acetylneuraminate synthase